MYLIKEINPKTSSTVENSLECWMRQWWSWWGWGRLLCESQVWASVIPFILLCAAPCVTWKCTNCNAMVLGEAGLRVKCFFSFWETHAGWWWEGKEERVCISAWARAANENGGGKKVAGYQSTILTMRKKGDQSNITTEEIWVCSDRFWRSHHKYDVAGKN